MRRVYITLTSCGAMVLLSLGLLFTYTSIRDELTLPGAADVQIDGHAFAREQQITYRLRSNQTVNDLYSQLELYGWRRDRPAEGRLVRDQIGPAAPLAAFTRQRLFGALSEIALVKGSLADSRRVEIQIFRCFRMFSPNQCF